MQTKHIPKPSVSIAIPAYNEAAYLKRCLDAIARQTTKPLEVIVVDNNSTDDTAAVAKQYPFVRLINEKQQGVVFARDRGFNAAKGDIIGRIDADTLVPANWVAKVQDIFMKDPELAATSGVMHAYDIALPHVVSAIDLFFRRRTARLLQVSDTVFLQGSNAAMRRSSWLHIRKVLCRQGQMHEDFDLAIHLQEYGHKVTFNERMHASISARRMDVSFINFTHYVRMNPHTYALHQLESRRHMYNVVVIALICYLPGRILHRGYDMTSGSFSLGRAVAPRRLLERPDPTKL